MNADSKNRDRNEERDNLQEIKGIGLDYERDLQKIGVLTFAQLAEFEDAEQLQQALEESGSGIQLWRIKQFGDWTDQARSKIHNQNSVPEVEETVASKHDQNQAMPVKEHSAFIVSFDRQTSKDDKDSWSTVVSFAETNEPLTRFMVPYRTDPEAWIKWLFEEADATEKFDLPETELVVNHVSAAETGKQLNVVNVQVMSPSTSIPQKELMVRVHFELLGSEAGLWTEESPSYRLELYLLDLESQATELVASAQKRLEPGVLEYEISEYIPIPSPGRYELYVLLLPLPPTEMMVTQHGPIINVVPHPVSAV